MVHLFQESALADDGLVYRLADVVNGPVRDVGGIENRSPLGRRFGHHDVGNQPLEFYAVLVAILDCAEARIRNQVLASYRSTEIAPEAAHVKRKHDVSIFHRHHFGSKIRKNQGAERAGENPG